MPVNLDELQADQEIFGSDGEKIGNVGGLFADPAGGKRYLKVDRLGIDLYVPEDVIVEAELGKPILLKVPKDEAVEQYVNRPGDLR
jgi:hypothetical protein